MLNVSHVFDRLRISKTSQAMATTDVGNMIRDSAIPLDTARKLVHDLLSLDIQFTDNIYAGIVCKKLIVECIKLQCEIEDEQLVLQSAIDYASTYCSNPDNSFLWSKEDNEVVEVQQVSKETETKVAVTATGKIKKGGKEILADELFQKFMINTATPLTNPDFVNVLMKELDMTKLGASTYGYNLRKKYGMVTPRK